MWITLLSAWIALASERSCEVSSLAGNCDQFPHTRQMYVEYADGKLLNPRLSSAQIRELPQESARNVTPARQQRVRQLFEYAKKQIRAQILHGRPEHALNQSERQLLKRLEITHFDGIDHCGAGLGANNEDHRVKICPSVANAPAATLVTILAHEIGHSLDSCACRHALLRRRPLSRQQVDGLLGPPPQLVNGKQRNPGPYESLRPLLRGEMTNLPGDYYTTLRRQSARPGQEALWSRIVAEGFSSELPELPEDQHPLGKVHECLFAPVLAARGGSWTVSARSTGEDLPSIAGCSGRESEMSADVWGARVLAGYLKEHPAQNTAERTAALGPALGEICQPAAHDDLSDDLSHGSYTYRYNNIYLQDPGVRSALGCAAPVSNSCMIKVEEAFGAASRGGSVPPAASPASTR